MKTDSSDISANARLSPGEPGISYANRSNSALANCQQPEAQRAEDNCSPADFASSINSVFSPEPQPSEIDLKASDSAGTPVIAATTRDGSQAKTSHGRRKLLIITAATLAILSAAGTAAFYYYSQVTQAKDGAHNAPSAVVTVSTEPAKELALDDTFTVTGSVSALEPLAVGTEVSGLRILAVKAEEGDFVKKGQVLANLNAAVLQAQLEQAQARLSSSHANLKKTVQPNRPEDIRALRAAVAQAQANIAGEEAALRQARSNLLNAQENAKRYMQLVGQGAVSKQDAETRQTTAETAYEAVGGAEAKVRASKSTAEQAQERLNMALLGGRREDVEISQAALREIQGNISQLKALIDQTVIRAPEDGLVTKRDAHIGDVSTSGKPLFYLIRSNQLELRAMVSDLDLGKFRSGQQVLVKPTETDSRSAIGQIWLISPQVDATTRLGTVRVALPSHSWIKPGMFVQGQVNLGKRAMLTVPLPAVVSHNSESVVYVVQDGRAQACPVKVGVRTESLAEIVSGLSNAQRVIVKGAGFVADGDIVKVSR
jgi:HlyD family secretion protein